MRFEDIEKGQKVAVKVIEYAPNRTDEYVAKENSGQKSVGSGRKKRLSTDGWTQDIKLPGRPRKIKSVKKGVVIFKNKFFFGVKKKNGFVECFTRAEMECGELTVDKE